MQRRMRNPDVTGKQPRTDSLGSGFGMIEFLFALAIFSAGMLGLLSAQLSGQRSIQSALDRSLATSLAMDLLARIELNSGEVATYTAQTHSKADRSPTSPPIDCNRLLCMPGEMAIFDWWDWSRQLDSSANAVLPEARVCITHEQGTATVSISWRGRTRLSAPSLQACAAHEADASGWRRHVQLSMFTGTL